LNHPAVWQAIQDRLAPAILDAGFAPHPAFPPRFDAGSGSYHQRFIAPAAADGLRLIDLNYDPAACAWQVSGCFYLCADAASRIAPLGRNARKWTTALSHLPRRDSLLIPVTGWPFRHPTSRQVDFNPHSGQPEGLAKNLDAALRGLPEFLDHLGRPTRKGKRPSMLPDYGLYD
jgi:hypothetical protein